MNTVFPYIHSDDIGGRVGTFFDTPILSWNPNDSAVREYAESLRYTRLNKEANVSLPQ